MMLASSLTECNSGLRADVPSIRLDTARMFSIESQRQKRRDRLTQLIDVLGQTYVSEQTGISPAYLYQMSKGTGSQARNVSDANARKIEKGLGLTVGWMDSEEPIPDFDGASLSIDATVVAPHATRAGYVRYQVMGEGGAGPGVINQDYPEVLQEVELAEWQVREEIGALPSPDRVKLLTVRGQSMAPRIRNGDVVFVDIEDKQMYDGGLFVVLLHGHALVKRLEIRTDGLHIVSLAAPERPDVVPPNKMHDVSIAGRVLGAIQLRKSDDL